MQLGYKPCRIVPRQAALCWEVENVQLVDVVASLQLDQSQDILSREWEGSQASLPAGDLFFLRPAYLADACRQADMPPMAVEAVVATAQYVAASPALSALAWHFQHCLCSTAYPRSAIADWPSVAHVLPGESEEFYLLTVLAGIPHVRDLYTRHSIPGNVVSDTLADVGRWAVVHHERHGTWGLALGNLNWLTNHLRCEIFQLGRLQFQLGSYHGHVRAFRHRQQGTVVALSEGGLSYRRDGQRNGAGGVTETIGVWESSLELKEDGVRGNPILPVGRALCDEVWLPWKEWEQVLAPGDAVLQLHIPAGSRLDFDQCGESFQHSLVFFPRHFPEFDFRAYAAGSWLLDLQLETLLPPNANLVRFLSEFYLLPIRSGGQEALRRVFGYVPDDLTRAPRDTTLRRALIDHLLAGGHWRGGGAFLMRQDLDWGKQVYRRQAFPWH
jgi:hypothetical protein